MFQGENSSIPWTNVIPWVDVRAVISRRPKPGPKTGTATPLSGRTTPSAPTALSLSAFDVMYFPRANSAKSLNISSSDTHQPVIEVAILKLEIKFYIELVSLYQRVISV
jgi:hypothetical protein